MNYLKSLASILALSAGLSFASGCKPAGEEGNSKGVGYDGGGMPPEGQCLTPKEFAETTIYSSTTVCPGTYRNAVLRVTADDVTLRGENVTLDGLLSTNKAIIAENVSRFHLQGFNIVNANTGVNLADVIDSTIELAGYSRTGGGIALYSRRGLAIKILGGELNGAIYVDGKSYEIKGVAAQDISFNLDIGCPGNEAEGIQIIGNTAKIIDLHSCGNGGHIVKDNEVERINLGTSQSNLTIENNKIVNRESYDGWKGAIGGTYIKQSTIRGNTIECLGSPTNVMNGLFLFFGNPAANSGFVEGNVQIEDNIIQNCQFGISISTQTNRIDRVDILNNTVTSNEEGVLFAASNSLIEGNKITDNNTKGFRTIVYACNNIIRNNDLRNNGGGNEVQNYEGCENTYEGNQE